jgi:hypothetical protein
MRRVFIPDGSSRIDRLGNSEEFQPQTGHGVYRYRKSYRTRASCRGFISSIRDKKHPSGKVTTRSDSSGLSAITKYLLSAIVRSARCCGSSLKTSHQTEDGHHEDLVLGFTANSRSCLSCPSVNFATPYSKNMTQCAGPFWLTLFVSIQTSTVNPVPEIRREQNSSASRSRADAT